MSLFLLGLAVAGLSLAVGVSVAEWQHTWEVVITCGAGVGLGVGLAYVGGMHDERKHRRTSHGRERIRR